MSIPILIVDAFVTDGPFTGNPAAVCILPPGGCDEPGVESRFQDIAAEMNRGVSRGHPPTTNFRRTSRRMPLRWLLWHL